MPKPPPDPLVPAEANLQHFDRMPLDVTRLLRSETWLTATGDEAKAAITLWCVAWHQTPAGSLPDDDRQLAVLSLAFDAWLTVKEVVLRSWVKCSDGRLYHPVVCEMVREAWGKKLAYQDFREEQRRKGKMGAAKRWGSDDANSHGHSTGHSSGHSSGHDGENGRGHSRTMAYKGKGKGEVEGSRSPSSSLRSEDTSSLRSVPAFGSDDEEDFILDGMTVIGTRPEKVDLLKRLLREKGPAKGRNILKRAAEKEDSSGYIEGRLRANGSAAAAKVHELAGEQFEAFWRAYPSRYPHQHPKKPARQKFMAALKRGMKASDIIRGAQQYAAYVQREGLESRFVAHASTWLNQERWTQDQEGPPTANGAGKDVAVATWDRHEWVNAYRALRETGGKWSSAWGPRPGEKGHLGPEDLEKAYLTETDAEPKRGAQP